MTPKNWYTKGITRKQTVMIIVGLIAILILCALER